MRFNWIVMKNFIYENLINFKKTVKINILPSLNFKRDFIIKLKVRLSLNFNLTNFKL